MAIFAIGDLHLGFAVDKPMDRFGPQWVDHPARIARAWRERVTDADTVLVCGDTSWAVRLEDVAPDLAYVAELPGRKILIRGNHDYWWGTLAKLRRVLPAGLEPLHNNSIRVEDFWVTGSRGWSLPVPDAEPADVAIFQHELERLRRSLESAPAGGRRIAMLHYPPCMPGVDVTSVVDLLVEFGVETCAYGHLHAMAPGTYPEGTHRGIEFHCVSADLVDFAPRRIIG